MPTLALWLACKGPVDAGRPVDTGPDPVVDTDTDVDADTDTDVDTDVDPHTGDSGDSAPVDTDNDTLSTADPIAPRHDFPYRSPVASEALDPPGDRDFFALEATRGEWYFVYVGTAGDGVPDPVLRLYDEAGDPIGVSDDLPYALRGPDAGYVLHAAYTGTYDLEVLERSDWLGDPPAGGPAYTYDLYVDDPGMPERAVDDNDTLAEVDAYVDAGNWLFVTDYWSRAAGQAWGTIDPSGDVDTWFVDLSASPWALQLSLFPWSTRGDAVAPSDLDPLLTVYDANGDELGSSTDPYLWPDDWVVYDAGATVVLPDAGYEGRYYFTVEDRSGHAGDATYYVALYAGYDLSGGTMYGDADTGAQPLAFTDEGTYAYAYFGGWIHAGEPAEAFTVDAVPGGLAGRYVSVVVLTADAASPLDATIELSDADGVVATDTPYAPYTRGFVEDYPTTTDAPLTVTVDPAASSPGGWYLGMVVVADVPVF